MDYYSHRRRLCFSLVVLGLCLLAQTASSDVESDKAECANKLAGLATCLPYAQGNAKAPKPDCCSGLQAIIDNSRKCLCLLIKDSNDPSLGFKFNVTRALALPTACKVPANISECPSLLNLSPNSTDAQIFEQAANSTAAASQGIDSSPTENTSPTSQGTRNSPRYGRMRNANSLSAFGKFESIVRVQEMLATVSVLLLVPLLLFT